jgi:RNA polymerase sigma-70 factor (ECF subfamily)
MEDSQIITLYWSRSEYAIRATAAKYGSYCNSIAYHILNDREDAEEVVEDTYLDAWNSIPPHRPMSLSTFLGKITRRRAIDRFRQNSAQKRGGGELVLALDELAQCIPAQEDVHETVQSRELARLLEAFLRGLPETQRQLFICRYWYLEPISELCRSFGFSQSKVKSMLHRTRRQLQRFLAEKGVFDEA